jgi:hypothetical protein
MSGRLGNFSLPNLSLFIVKVLAGEYPVPPARGKIIVVFWQGPHAMQVVGQHYPGIDMEGVALTHRTYRLAKEADMIHQMVYPPFH